VRRKNNLKEDGSVLLALVFLVFIFFVGAALLTFSITHTRIVGARSIYIQETGRMRQETILYLHHLRNTAFSEKVRQFDAPETEFFNSEIFLPEEVAGRYIVTPSFTYDDTPRNGFKISRINASVDIVATPQQITAGNRFHISSGSSFDILAGKIPVTYFPVFIQLTGIGADDNFFAQNNVINYSSSEMVVGDIDTQMDFATKIYDTFQIPDEHTYIWRHIRDVLGLEPLDEPLDEGIYILVEGTIVSGIFVQGDVQDMVFSVSLSGSDYIQEIEIIKNSVSYTIRYIPKGNFLECWDSSIRSDLVFGETLIVNGSVESIRQEGEAAFASNACIELLISAQAAIRSNLLTQESPLTVNTLKMTNLTLAAGFQYLFNMDDEPEPSVIAVEKTSDAEIQANIIVNGKFTNKSQQLKLTGSLYGKELDNRGRIIVNHRKPRGMEDDTHYFRTVDFKYVNNFIIHYIEEVSDE